MPYLDNYWSDSFGPKCDPPVFGVLHLPKYFGNLSNFTSHAIPNFQKCRSLTVATLITPPLPGIKLFSCHHIKHAVHLLKPHKAPGPDGIPNVVLTKCIDALIDHLYFIFRAVLELNVYHEWWLRSITLVLCKIGKTTYNIAKLYHPISLLDTIGKLLSTLIVADQSHFTEKHNMFPAMQFGGRPGCCTTDAMHVVAHKIKDAWHAGKVAFTLFLDVQGAFPNMVKDQLIHNMKIHCIPLCYIKLIELVLPW